MSDQEHPLDLALTWHEAGDWDTWAPALCKLDDPTLDTYATASWSLEGHLLSHHHANVLSSPSVEQVVHVVLETTQ